MSEQSAIEGLAGPMLPGALGEQRPATFQNSPLPEALVEAVPIAELRRLCEAATDGSWLVRPLKHDDWGYIRTVEGRIVAVARAGSDYEPDDFRRAGTDPSQHNADFIAAAREWLPKLLDLVEQNSITAPSASADRHLEASASRRENNNDRSDERPLPDAAPSSLVLETTADLRQTLKEHASSWKQAASFHTPSILALLRDHERQAAEIARLEGELAEVNSVADSWRRSVAILKSETTARVATAREEEREACATLADIEAAAFDEKNADRYWQSKRIAAAIRARGRGQQS